MDKMKKNITFVLVLGILFVLLALAVTPAGAERKNPAIGERINIGGAGGDMNISAGVPFHIRHGWMTTPGGTQAIGIFDFDLEIEALNVRPGLRYFDFEAETLMRIYNFPDGLPEGTYAYIGRWYAPCQYVNEDLANCPILNKSVLFHETTGNIIVNP